MIDLLSLLPLTVVEAIDRVCGQGFTEEDARRALELQQSFKLLERQEAEDFGSPLIYNEYLWGKKLPKISNVLLGLRREQTDQLLALLEEVKSNQGQAIDRLTSAPDHIKSLAIGTGILDSTTIVTSSGDQKSFCFSPHFYGYRAGSPVTMLDDTADQVKLFVASIGYGVNYSSDFRLQAPLRFVQALLERGSAGNATPILRDYPLLELHGIVTVEERVRGRGTFILRKRDVVEHAFDVMQSGGILDDMGGGHDVRALISQRAFHSPEFNRIAIGNQAAETRWLQDEMISAIRETAQLGGW